MNRTDTHRGMSSIAMTFAAVALVSAAACDEAPTPTASTTTPAVAPSAAPTAKQAASAATAPATASAPVAGLPSASAAAVTATSLYDFSPKNLEGVVTPLSVYKGKVVLVVNTASQCGFTPQYEGLEALDEKYASKGFHVLGFPSNDFGGQEPGTATEIRQFCTTKFKVKFPLFEKVITHGDGVSPIYAFLEKDFGEPKWNFHKYLVGKDGKVKRAFPSKVTPDSKELSDAIDAALAE